MHINNRKLQTEAKQINNEINQTNYEMNQTDNETLLKKTLSNETDIISEETQVLKKDNPFLYLTVYYIIFVMMSAYMICVINRSPIPTEMKEQIKSDIYRFLFLANNGSLLVSVISLGEVYRANGFVPLDWD